MGLHANRHLPHVQEARGNWRVVQESPRDADGTKGLLPKVKSVNWNQDPSGVAISQYETFDEDDSADGADGTGRGDHACSEAYVHLPTVQHTLYAQRAGK